MRLGKRKDYIRITVKNRLGLRLDQSYRIGLEIGLIGLR